MKSAYYIGMDIAKLNFQVFGATKEGKKIYNRKFQRGVVLTFFANITPCVVGIEACGGAHFWGRELTKLGNDVRLISPRLVKPFVINNKTDAADAEAICEVLRRPSGCRQTVEPTLENSDSPSGSLEAVFEIWKPKCGFHHGTCF